VILRFGDCRLDVESRQLVHDGQEEHLSPKAFDLLVALLEARPKVLSKECLMNRVWPDVFVSEANLAVLIAEIREAIGDSAKSALFVKTHHGVGYSFMGQVMELTRGPHPPASGPTVVLQVGTRRIVLRQGPISAGRDELSDVVLFDHSVSRHHARLRVDGGHVTVEDLGSKNGTRVNGMLIVGETPVGHGAEIQFGDLVARLVVDETSTDTTWTIVSRP
jgi:DNA-binding winged helix-turn-helix (wHTH) protein